MEARDTAGAIKLVAYIVEPDFLAVGGVKERGAKLALISGNLVDTLGIALGLYEYALRPERDFLGLHHAEGATIVTERIVGWAVSGFELLNGGLSKSIQGH